MKRRALWVLAVGMILLWGVAGCSFFEDKTVSLVKNGHLNNYPASTVGEAFDSFFSNPQWKSFTSDKGKRVVEFAGKCMYFEKEVTVKMQFVVSDDKTFEIEYLDVNDIPQNRLLMAALLSKVYEKAGVKKTEETNAKTKAASNKPNSTTDRQAAQTLLYGNWGIYATDWVKYKFKDSNLRIVTVEAIEPNGESKIWVDTMDGKTGKWSSEYCRTLLEVKYNDKIKKHEMTITRKANANGTVLTDADSKKKFVKVPFE